MSQSQSGSDETKLSSVDNKLEETEWQPNLGDEQEPNKEPGRWKNVRGEKIHNNWLIIMKRSLNWGRVE